MKQYIALTAKIQFTTAVHIGSGKGGETTDAPLRRDAQGRIVLPGTAIAGALRSTATRLAPRMNLDSQDPFCAAIDKGKTELKPCACPVCHLFGDLHPGTEENAQSPKTHASHLWIYDAPLSENQAAAFVRDGVGIDRASGASASAGAAKFDLEVLPVGASFELRMELRELFEHDMMLLAATLAEWQAGRGRLGGRTARGLGAFELKGLRCATLKLDTGEDLIRYLTSKKPWEAATADDDWMPQNLKKAIGLIQNIPEPKLNKDDKDKAEKAAKVKEAVAQSWVTISFDLQFQGPFLIHDATLAGLIGYDHAPLLEKLPPANRDDKWRARPVLSGAGLRGVLRSHAERIARTLATHQAWGQNDPKEFFLNHCPACNPLQSKEKAPLANCDKLLSKHPVSGEIVLSSHKSAEKEHLCLACWLFGSTRRGSRLSIQDAGMIWENEEKRLPYKPQDFLAIDRFTGGGLEGAKFDALGLYAPRFGVIMHLENPADWELGWLTLVLRDLRDELVTFGFGAAKGYGMAKAENFEVKLGFISAEDIPLARKKDETEKELQARKDALAATAPKDRQSLYAVLPPFGESSFAANKAILEDWVAAFNKKVESFDRSKPEMKLPSPVSDTYFKDDLPKLYSVDSLVESA